MGDSRASKNIAMGKKQDGTPIAKGKMPMLGTGKRFSNLKNKLNKKGAKDPGALAAWIGRKKFGKKKFQKLAAKGK
jgi:hypothetical protein